MLPATNLSNGNFHGKFYMELSIINKKLAMDSRDIATLTHKSHSHIIRDIRVMYEKLGKTKTGFTYKDKQGKERPYFLLDYEDTITLLTGYSVELRSAVVKRWLYLEKDYKNERRKSIEIRNTFTDTLKVRGYSQQYEYINTTKAMKKKLGVNHKKDEMTSTELKAIYASEALANYLFTENRQERCHLSRWLMNCRNLLLTIII